jgi:tetratricopeptide (TPR) repeat protein
MIPFIILPLLLVGQQIWQHVQKRRRAQSMAERVAQIETQKPDEAEATPQQSLWKTLSPHIISVVVTIAMIIALPPLLAMIPNPGPIPGLGSAGVIVILVLLAIILLLVPIFLLGILFWPFLRIYFPLRRGDYATAIQRLDAALKKQPENTMFLGLKSAILKYQGQFPAAEELARTLLAKEQEQKSDAEQRSLAFSTLAEALRGQGRYDEAQKELERALELYPSRTGPYYELAEVYLYQGIEAQRAEELLLLAVERHQKRNFMMRWLEREDAMYIWGNLAWAHALQGERAKSMAALEQAWKQADRGFRPAMAGLHYRAGQMWRALGDKQQAREHFRHAQEFDAVGHYGMLAYESERLPMWAVG